MISYLLLNGHLAVVFNTFNPVLKGMFI